MQRYWLDARECDADTCGAIMTEEGSFAPGEWVRWDDARPGIQSLFDEWLALKRSMYWERPVSYSLPELYVQARERAAALGIAYPGWAAEEEAEQQKMAAD